MLVSKKNYKKLILKAFSAVLISFILVLLFLCLYSYNSFDPSPFTATDEEATNYLGKTGSTISSIIFFIYGEGSWLILISLFLMIRLSIFSELKISNFLTRIFINLISIFMISLSLVVLEYNVGIMGKALIAKLMKNYQLFLEYEKLIYWGNLILFANIYFLSLSKGIKSFYLVSFIIFYKSLNFLFLFFSFLIRQPLQNIKNKKINKTLTKNKNEINKKGFKKFLPPSLELLDDNIKIKRRKTEDIHINSKNLERVLEDYGIRGDIVSVREGPIVTRYELEPAPGTRSSRVISLSDDIARSMSAQSARVSVVYGKNAIGIELPNSNVETVCLRDIIISEAFKRNTGLSISLGKSIEGKPIVADLSIMPHILVAGTTGSGKSVSINAMILSLLYKYGPKDCKFILIDPKMLELSIYDGIPHLLHPVVTEPRKAISALKWAVREMNERYKQMTTLNVRNIESYNKIISKRIFKDDKLVKKVQVGFDSVTGKPIYQNKEIELSTLPFIVIIVDEMADLMLTAGKEIELSIQSLAQKARAAGIHLILATQRPSVDVITGTIKANLPYRISFQVTSKIDSRTILGEQGAEQLLGKGDMLYMTGGGRTERIHGPFVSDQEIMKITSHLKAQGEPEYLHHITENKDEDSTFNEFEKEDIDPFYDKALSLIIREKKVSTSFLQRHFAIGYNRAARIVDAFEKKGIVSSPNSMGRREILINRDDI